jgi:RNA polymerase sigma factor (sigma-70 family)
MAIMAMQPTLTGDAGVDVEERLARRAREGDGDAYGELVRRHRRAALHLATVVLGTSEGADDVVQLALERAWRSMARFDPDRAFRPWLLRIVANTARNDRRSRGRRAQLAARAARATADGVVTSPEELVVGDVERRRVVEALNRLDTSDREVITLRHYEQLSEREMAEVLDRPPGTVKSRLSRAMARLRAELVVAALAVALIVGAAGLVVAPVREAVADVVDWFRLGSTEVERAPSGESDPTGLPPIDAGLAPVSPEVAEATLGWRPPVVTDTHLGAPEVVALPPEGGVLLAWRHGSTSLWAQPTQDPAHVRVSKLLDGHDRVEQVPGLGDAAVLIEDPHVLRTPHRRLAAGTVLLWIDDGFEYRLESDGGRSTMLRLAQSIDPG